MSIGLTDMNGNIVNPEDANDGQRIFMTLITAIGKYVSQVAMAHDYNPGYAVANLNDKLGEYYKGSKEITDKFNSVLKLISNNVDVNSMQAYETCDALDVFKEPSPDVKARIDKSENDSLDEYLNNVIIDAPDEVKTVIKFMIGTALKLQHDSDPINRSAGNMFVNDANMIQRFIYDNHDKLTDMINRGVRYADKQVVDLMIEWLADNHDSINHNNKNRMD